MHTPMRFDVVIVGGGVTGTAVLYALTGYSNIHSALLIEQYGGVAQVNSSPRNNSQTLHWGDIETNYGLSKALPIKQAAEAVVAYVHAHEDRDLYSLTNKMVLAVGEAEVAAMRRRYKEFKLHYPGLELLDASQIAVLEPRIMVGRDPKVPVVALLSHDGYAINYQALSESFLADSLEYDNEVSTLFRTEVVSITRIGSDDNPDSYFQVKTYSQLDGLQIFDTSTVVVAAGPYSLLFAQAMGYGTQLGILPVAGSFYFTDEPVLSNKVYTVQNPALPFAAVHGDPDVVVQGQTRFGPTAKVLPLLERHKYASMKGFWRKPLVSIAGIMTLLHILSDLVVARFIIKNFFYDVPVLGKWLFLKQARKIVPGITWQELKLGKGLGGIRPQVIDTVTHTMQMGESRLDAPGIIFNTTPSPGASVALSNGAQDAERVIGFLGGDFHFDRSGFDQDHSIEEVHEES